MNWLTTAECTSEFGFSRTQWASWARTGAVVARIDTTLPRCRWGYRIERDSAKRHLARRVRKPTFGWATHEALHQIRVGEVSSVAALADRLGIKRLSAYRLCQRAVKAGRLKRHEYDRLKTTTYATEIA